MKGIVGKKLGMTQVFDSETGTLTPVTVIEAGPCPVVAVRTAENDGYDAVQLAFDEVPERKLTKPELGHLAKYKLGPHRRLVELRGPSELALRELPLGHLVEGELDGVIAVLVGSPHRDDGAGPRLDHRHGREHAGLLVEDLGHAQLLADDAFHASSGLTA